MMVHLHTLVSVSVPKMVFEIFLYFGSILSLRKLWLHSYRLIWILYWCTIVLTHFPLEVLLEGWVFEETLILRHREILVIDWSCCSLLFSFEEDKLGSIRVLKYAFEVHGVIDLVLYLQSLLKEEVVMSLLQCVKGNVSVLLSNTLQSLSFSYLSNFCSW